jgi:hypothetical protein
MVRVRPSLKLVIYAIYLHLFRHTFIILKMIYKQCVYDCIGAFLNLKMRCLGGGVLSYDTQYIVLMCNFNFADYFPLIACTSMLVHLSL